MNMRNLITYTVALFILIGSFGCGSGWGSYMMGKDAAFSPQNNTEIIQEVNRAINSYNIGKTKKRVIVSDMDSLMFNQSNMGLDGTSKTVLKNQTVESYTYWYGDTELIYANRVTFYFKNGKLISISQ